MNAETEADIDGAKAAIEPRDDEAHIAANWSRFQARYLDGWQSMLRDWLRPGGAACTMWLMYASSYLFRTGDVRWAIDPLRPNRMVGLPHEVPLEALKSLSFVLLTHDHADHWDPVLLASLLGTATRIVVPEAMRDRLVGLGFHNSPQVVVARPGTEIVIAGIRIEPFAGWHEASDNPASRGYPATGYFIQVEGRRWLFPVDVRDYRAADLAAFDAVDCLFAHLWLGRQCALMEYPPLIVDFSDFVQRCKPRAMVLAHLYEFSRTPDDLWHERHLGLLLDHWRKTGVRIPLRVPSMFEALDL